MNADLHKAAYWYRHSVEQGRTEAQHVIGRCHEFGLGECDKSDATAEKLYALAAAKNDPRA